jgi:hypothetical protein
MTTAAMTVLTFDPAGVRRIVERMTVAADWSRGFDNTSQPRPQIVFVKDEGIYLMSNGKPRDIVEGERSFVVYAEGYDPRPESAAPHR